MSAPDPLRWHAFGFAEAHAWTTEGGKPTPHHFEFTATHEGYRVDVRQVGKDAPVLPILSLLFRHKDWTPEAIRAFAETLRPALPTLPREQWLPIARIEEMIAARLQVPPACYFHHVFPHGAGESTACKCGRITKGFYVAQRAKEVGRGDR